MLNLAKNKIFSATKNVILEKTRIKTSKHFPSSTREWKNSIYLYNKANLNVIPITDLASKRIIKSYFSLFNKNLDKALRTNGLISRYKRRMSQSRIFFSNGEFKHTNNKVVINLYLFNRQIVNFNIAIERLRNIYLNKLLYSREIFKERLSIIEQESFNFLNEKRFKSLKRKQLILIENFNKNRLSKRTSSYISICIKKFFLMLIKKEYDKTLRYFFYKQLIFINKSKFTYLFLQYLKQHMFKIYNKQVEFNFINLRRLYLNSDILIESLINKISRKRKRVLSFIKRLRDKVLILKKKPFLHNYIINKKPIKKIDLSNGDIGLGATILNKLKYKDVTGFKLKAKGRLTKRYTASRSVLKVVNKGNLQNLDSSFKGLSSVLLKGNLKSNHQYTKSASKSRIGAFGLKGWISSY